MAKVFAPFCSFLAKGKFGGVIQCQPEPYTKGPAANENPQSFTFEIEGEEYKKNIVTDFLFPISGFIWEKCEMERVMKMVPVTGGFPPDWARERMSFDEWARLQNIAFKEARALFNTLSEQQKTSWTIFGQMFVKQDICTLVGSVMTGFEVFMSFAMFLKLFGFVMKLWAPVMDASLSAEAMRRGWKATYWYYAMKQASLRRAWVLYRHHRYTIKQVMSVTEVWYKFKKWWNIKQEIMQAANVAWHLW